ncbi:MAG: hypothetical protein IKN14_06795 [Clostridiales bacterium]|nr:hypothetical protein [Clostridiales bacterium]
MNYGKEKDDLRFAFGSNGGRAHPRTGLRGFVLKETPYLKFYPDIADDYSIYGYDSAPSDDGLTRIRIPVRLLRLSDPYTLTVVSNDHSYSKTITYSAFDYCGKILETSSNEDLKDLVKALYFYYEAAIAYNDAQ